MTLAELLNDLDWVAHQIWHIPDGIATLTAGVLALGAGIIAWRGVQRQIRSQERLEQVKNERERKSLETALTAELLVFSRALIEATSAWNQEALEAGDAHVETWPLLPRPSVYDASSKKSGCFMKGGQQPLLLLSMETYQSCAKWRRSLSPVRAPSA